jgi:signal transduction histidine kinase
MDFLRNQEVRSQIALCAVTTCLFGILGVAFCRKFWWIPLLAGCAVSGISLVTTYRRYKRISALSQDIDRLLHGDDSIRFDDYKEGELAVLGDEISKMTLRLLEQSEQLKRDKNYLADSLADISHQLKTPLTSLEILNATLSQESTDEEQRAVYLREQAGMLMRMEWLIDALLKLSRLDAGMVRFENKTFQVSELLRQATQGFDLTLDIKDITLDISAPEKIELRGDIKWLAEAISNIIKNSIENTPPGGRIAIRAEENPMYVKLTITDSGDGIPEEDLPHLFERFYRGKSTGKNGVGIGLALAKTITAGQNGNIKAENIEPHGAQFTVCFYKGIA